MKVTILYVISLWGMQCCLAQTILFQKVYGGQYTDAGYAAQQTSDKGYIIAGYSDGFSSVNNVYVVKTDSVGDTLWTKTYGGMNEDAAYSVQQTSDGGYVVAGSSSSYGQDGDAVLYKLTASGNISWLKNYGGPGGQGASSVKQTMDGGYILSGTYGTSATGSDDVYLIKTDASGDTLWTKKYGGTWNDGGSFIQQTTDGGYIITGYNSSTGAGGSDVYLLRTNSVGDTLWTRTYGGTANDYGRSVRETSEGGFIIAGSTASFGPAAIYLVKTDLNGDTLWTKVLENGMLTSGYSVLQTSDGGYVVAGNVFIAGESNNGYLVKTNSVGDTLWAKMYGGVNGDGFFNVSATSDAGFALVGSSASFPLPSSNSDIYFVKTDSLGNTGGWNEINEYARNQPEVNIFPNPFNTQANLLLPHEINTNEDSELRIYDMYGNETTRVIISSHSAIIQRDNLAAGMYFCKVVSNNTVVATGKFIIQ